MNKEEQIEYLTAEILAARETIKGLTKAIEELSKNKGPGYVHYPIYVQPYRYTYPQWTYTVSGVTYNSAVTNTANTATLGGSMINIARDDDEGDAGVRAAV